MSPNRPSKPRVAGLRAFVAMRIGDAQTDSLFEKAIRPALRAVGTTAIRIDRVEYNDDIDDRIIKEIDRADIVVADLTFARPSVYFEGGYAAGLGKPVIYTARRDHLKDKDDDPLGNLRVHFDLQMKNIIDWSDPQNAAFRERLERRLRFVLAPILQSRKADADAAAARQELARMSSSRRVDLLSQQVETFATNLGYRLARLEEDGVHSRAIRHLKERPAGDVLSRGLIGTRQAPGTIDALWVRVEESLPVSTLRAINTLIELAPPHDMNPPKGIRPMRVVEHVILCSVRSIPASRIQTAFRAFDQIEDREYAASIRVVVPSSRMGNEVILVGRLVPGAVWRAMALEAKEPHADVETYVVRNGQFETPAYPQVNISFFLGEAEPKLEPKAHGKVRDVPRKVHIHVLDKIDSVPVLMSRLESLAQRF